MSDPKANDPQVSVTVDQEACIGCGMCANICGDVFEMDDGIGRAFVRKDAMINVECMEEAADNCPVGAIIIDDDDEDTEEEDEDDEYE